MRTSKKVVALCTAAFATLALTSCGGSDKSGDSGASASGKQVTLTYFANGTAKVMKPLIDAFEKKYPNIHVEVSSAPGGPTQYENILTTRAAGGQLADVFHFGAGTRFKVIDAGWAKDLTNEPFMKGIAPNAKEFYSKNGKVYGMAPTAWMGVMIYNKDLLKSVGYDSMPTKLSDFIDMSKKLEAKGIAPYMENPKMPSQSFATMVHGYYAKQGDKQGDEDIFSGKKKISEKWGPVLDQWYKLVTSKAIPASEVGLSPQQIEQQFLAGKLAVFRGGLWNMRLLKKSNINFEAAAFPGVEGGEPWIGGGPDPAFVINAKIKGAKLDAAEKFLAFVNSKEGLEVIAKSTHQMSTSAKFTPDLPKQFKKVYEDYAKTGKMGEVEWNAHANTMDNEMVAQFQKLIQQQTTPAAVLQALDKTWAAAAQ